MLEVLLFFMSIWTFVLNLSNLNIHTTIKKFCIEIMPSSTPHQKFCFYHLPTRDEQELSLGMLDTSPTYILFFIVPCYYIIYFGCLMGFIIHFYTNFGNNLITGGPVQIAIFLPISVFCRKGISNGIQTERTLLSCFTYIIFRGF